MAINPFSNCACLMSRPTKLHWLVSCASILLAGLVFGATLDSASVSSQAYYLVNQALFTCLAGYLLLPAARGLGGLLANSASCVALFVILAELTLTPGIPAIMLLQVAVVVFCLGLLLWSLNQFFDCLFSTQENTGVIVILLLTCVTTAPLWMGPAVDIYQLDNRLIDWVVAMTPLTHVSVAAQYDYLRSAWLYRNSSFGSLPFVYPGFYGITTGYFVLVSTLQIIIRGVTRRPRMLLSLPWLRRKP